jgi:hypothetical protein
MSGVLLPETLSLRILLIVSFLFKILDFKIPSLVASIVLGFVCFESHLINALFTGVISHTFFHKNKATFVGSPQLNAIQSVILMLLFQELLFSFFARLSAKVFHH